MFLRLENCSVKILGFCRYEQVTFIRLLPGNIYVSFLRTSKYVISLQWYTISENACHSQVSTVKQKLQEGYLSNNSCIH